MNLPNPGMDFTALNTLPASDLDKLVENIEALAAYFGEPTADWNGVGAPPNTVTCNGNRSYTLVFNSVDYTSFLSPGMRLKTTRTVAAPTQCTSLNGTTQYYSKSSPAGMTFTDDSSGGAWVKLTSYKAAGMTIASRYNGTSGWTLVVLNTGQVQFAGFNAGPGNVSYVQSYQSLPLNKWVHVSAQLDMSAFTATPTTSYVMLDGVDAPSFVARAGTNPTALIQAGNLEIGSQNGGGLPFDGKLAQVAIFSAKVTQATMRGYMSQKLAGTETSLISAYSFNNSIADLNTTNANNLTANGSAVATNADSPFGGQAGGLISSTLDYAIIQSVSFSTNTTVVVQVAEGCTIPTSGGVASISYSIDKTPYLFPSQEGKWAITSLTKASYNQSSAVDGTWYNVGSQQLSVPTGEWRLGYQTSPIMTASTVDILSQTLSTASNSESDTEYTTEQYVNVGGAIHGASNNRYRDRSISSMTPYYLNLRHSSGTGTPILYNTDGTLAPPSIIEAVNAFA